MSYHQFTTEQRQNSPPPGFAGFLDQESGRDEQASQPQTGGQLSSIQASARPVRPAATVHCGVQCVANSQDPSVSAGGSGALVFSVIPALLRDGNKMDMVGLIGKSAERMSRPEGLSAFSSGPWQPKITGRSCWPCISAKTKCVLTEGVSCAPCTKRGLKCEGGRAAYDPSKAGAQGQTPSAATDVPATVHFVSGSHCNSAA
jgi:hypothetical protein